MMAKSKRNPEPISFIRTRDLKKTKFRPQKDEELDAKLKKLQKKLQARGGD